MFLTGLLVGGAIASSADRSASYQSNRNCQLQSQVLQAQAEAREAKNQAELARQRQEQKTLARRAQVIIPQGAFPGHSFSVSLGAEPPIYITVPPGYAPGMSLLVQFPDPQATPPLVVQGFVSPPPNPIISNLGRDVLNDALSNAVYMTTADHFVNESDPAYANHNIISVGSGERVYIIEGSLETGLPSPYQEYISVRLVNTPNKTGKISRFCLVAV